MVASHLLKLCDYWQDALGHRTELRYIRDETGKECDFVVLKDRKPVFAVECKLNSTDVSPSLLHFKSKLDIPKWYQVHLGEKNRVIDPTLSILSFDKFCKEVGLI
jgi:predicted AAA+ superfamily ATPase